MPHISLSLSPSVHFLYLNLTTPFSLPPSHQISVNIFPSPSWPFLLPTSLAPFSSAYLLPSLSLHLSLSPSTSLCLPLALFLPLPPHPSFWSSCTFLSCLIWFLSACQFLRSLPLSPAHFCWLLLSPAHSCWLPLSPADSRWLPLTPADPRWLPHVLMHTYLRENDKSP